MRNLIIHRKKAFAGAICPYTCILNMEIAQLQELLNQKYDHEPLDSETDEPEHLAPLDVTEYKIKNGETITVYISDSINTLFVTLNGNCSNQVTIEAGNEDVFLLLNLQLAG